MISRLLLGAAVSVIIFTIGIAGLGWKPYVVMSDSMAPSMHAGDLIFVDPHARTVSVYEIVTYTDRRGPITHRVISQASDGALTVKGDANAGPDPAAVDRASVVGPVRLILPRLGWPVMQVHTHPVKVAGGALLLALLLPGRRLLGLLMLGGLVAAVAMVPTTGATLLSAWTTAQP
ncbi:signal peptidase I [Dactylosporangium sp. NPDC000555]|uniref:signal peptidase I n=1 Tax=Dactylosporangium sp. NPDC000555 TaxID=3154260 RepID=UPI00332436D6